MQQGNVVELRWAPCLCFLTVMEPTSRDRIFAILKAHGTPMMPKQVHDAQPEPKAMKEAAIRKLMPEMMRAGLRKKPGKSGGYYLTEGLSEKHIAVAHRNELYAALETDVDRHQRQRRTTRADVIWALQKLLRKMTTGR